MIIGKQYLALMGFFTHTHTHTKINFYLFIYCREEKHKAKSLVTIMPYYFSGKHLFQLEKLFLGLKVLQ